MTLLGRRVVVAVAGVLLLGLGVVIGMRVPWGTRHADATAGTAVRPDAARAPATFDARDGTQASFDATRIWWTSNSDSGQGDPPCLSQPGAKARVEVGLMDVAQPGGGSHREVVWLRCLG